MDIMLQRHCAKYIYVVPDGLRELLSDISREVLRTQPENIYSFIADYLDALMITRENARVAARLVESITEIGATIAELLIRTGMTREEADRVVIIIQTAFRKHLERKAPQHPEPVDEATMIATIIEQAGITPEQAEEAAIVIQNAYRNFKARQERERELLKGMVDWRAAARSTINLYRKTGVTFEEANRAATLIKAAYKGYYTRRLMRRLLEESLRKYEEETKSSGSYEEYGEEYAAFWVMGEQSDDDDDHREKLVRIDYDTVTPHVDFDEPTIIMEEEDDTAIALGILDEVLTIVVPPSDTEIVQTEVAPGEQEEVVEEIQQDQQTEVEALPPQEQENAAEDAQKAEEPQPEQGAGDEPPPTPPPTEAASVPTDASEAATDRTEYTEASTEPTATTTETTTYTTEGETTEEGEP